MLVTGRRKSDLCPVNRHQAHAEGRACALTNDEFGLLSVRGVEIGWRIDETGALWEDRTVR